MKKLAVYLLLIVSLFTFSGSAYAYPYVTYQPTNHWFNPNSSTYTVKFKTTGTETVGVYIKDFDRLNTVKTLFSGTVNAGTEKSVTWDGKNSSGAIVGNGQYYFYIYSQTGSYALTKVSIHGSTGPAFMYNPFNWHNYWNITAYFDRDPNAGTAKDYRNGTATVYDGHKGTDFSTGGTTGKPLYAAMSGAVIRSRYDTLAGYYVAVKDSNNRIVMYQHMLEGGRPAEGTNVAAGQQVGYSGNTGQSTGPHLHIRYEVNNVWTTPYDIYNSSYSLLIQDPRPTGYYSATLTP